MFYGKYVCGTIMVTEIMYSKELNA